MSRPVFILVVLLATALVISCSDDDGVSSSSSSQSSGYTDAVNLFGLVDGRTLIYVQTDTTWTDGFGYNTKTYRDTVNISGAEEDWIIMDGSVPVLNLKVSNGWVLQNGYWNSEGSTDVFTDIDPSPVLISPEAEEGDIWEGHFPSFVMDGQDPGPFYCYSYFGFFYNREFIGLEQLQVPGGAFDAYRIDVKLFWNPFDTEPAAVSTEYYVPGIGLVKLRYVGGPLRRTMSLFSYN
ncbi:MAG: hypothetical protein U9R56_01765 [candidate division Zixibacteria bacterium]|nr:hypothetical protein [candidate division Zixibacteria bacterium]